MIGIGLESSVLNSFCNAPIRVAREHWRGALYDHQSLCTEVPGHGFVKSGGIKLAQRVVRGVREIDYDEIEAVRVRLHPGKRVWVDDANFRRGKRSLIQGRQHCVSRK